VTCPLLFSVYKLCFKKGPQHYRLSCVRNICGKNRKIPLILFKVTIDNVDCNSLLENARCALRKSTDTQIISHEVCQAVKIVPKKFRHKETVEKHWSGYTLCLTVTWTALQEQTSLHDN